jgi:Hsp70 protein
VRLQVKATNGDTFLGGEDFDNVLLQVSLLGWQLSMSPARLSAVKSTCINASTPQSSCHLCDRPI